MIDIQRVTIKQVAREAGVSTQTVSRVLNERPDVADETRRKVEETIERLGYHPSALARSLIRQRSFTLGVVTAGLKHIGPSRTLNGIAQQAEAMGYTLLLKELPGFETVDARPILRALLSRQVDGILWAVPEIGANRDWLADSLPEPRIPLLFLTMSPRPGVPVVSVDNYQGGCLAVQHLLDQGYRRIGHLAGPQEWWEARQRKTAWQATLAAAGAAPEERNWVEGNWSSASGERAIERLLEQAPELDAVFVANDQMALSVLQSAHRRGKRIPQDLGVVGFDGLPESAYFWPSLTTIDPGLHGLGCTAVQELVAIIEAGRLGQANYEPQTILLQPTLVIRDSSKRSPTADPHISASFPRVIP
jgi:DNA-binding LacI/PurR family transcriptional regulator